MGDSSADPIKMAHQLALQTLNERCKNFQDRVSELEKENVKLRTKCIEVDTSKHSETEFDKLHRKIAELTEQKSQLKNNVMIVASENRELWSRLTKLMQVNKTLDKHFSKINNSLKQHDKLTQSVHSPLIRSKTFTQEEPHLKVTPRNAVELHDAMSLELEDISLKLISNIAKEKSELELQCSQMAEIQNDEVDLSNSFGFKYSYDDADDTVLDFDNHVTELKNVKEMLLQNKEKFIKNMDNLRMQEDKRICKDCQNRKKEEENERIEKEKKKGQERNENEKETEELESLRHWGSLENTSSPAKDKTVPEVNDEVDKICPMCSRMFTKEVPFAMYQLHVESHFLENSFEVL